MRTPSESVKRQPVGAPSKPGTPRDGRVIPAADIHQVLREQLEYLIGHVETTGRCGCSLCERYGRVRGELLSAFRD